MTQDERDALEKIRRRPQASEVESLPRLAVSIFYAVLLIWLVVLVRAAWVGESYMPMRNGHSMLTTGAALWVECTAPLFYLGAIFFRLDAASLRFRDRRVWAILCVLAGSVVWIAAPHLFGKMTFLR